MTEQTGNNKPNEAEALAFPLSGNEKLIEEALAVYWDGIDNAKESGSFEGMRAALAVFEKALTPTDDEREALISAAHKEADQRYGATEWTDGPGSSTFRRVDRGKAGAFVEGALWRDRRSEVPEPSTEVLSDWFTSSHGVAVAAVKPMTDRGPSVMVDGRVISPNDVAALIEFKAQGERFSEIPEPSTIWHENAPEPQGEPSDARAKVIDALVMTRLSDFAGTDMGVIEQAADAVLAALRAAGVGGVR